MSAAENLPERAIGGGWRWDGRDEDGTFFEIHARGGFSVAETGFMPTVTECREISAVLLHIAAEKEAAVLAEVSSLTELLTLARSPRYGDEHVQGWLSRVIADRNAKVTRPTEVSE